MVKSRTAANYNVQNENNKPNDNTQSVDNKPNDVEDLEFKRSVTSTGILLGCIGSKSIEACSISITPKHLRESNEDAYTPKFVSIGPLYKIKRTEKDLLYMEEIKLRCMSSLLHRTKDPKESLTKCSKAMCKLDEVIRASYIHDLKLINIYDLAKIMLLDGCFLLELLISNDEKLDDKLECTFNPGTEVVKKENVLFDLIVLENQIPLVVLYILLTKLFPNDFTMKDGKEKEDRFREEKEDGSEKNEGRSQKREKKEDSEKVVNRLALSLFVQSLDDKINTGFKAAHLLELLHSFMTRKSKKQAAETEDNHCTIDVDIVEVQRSGVVKKSHELALKRCATKLEAAGVRIKTPRTADADNLGETSRRYGVVFDFDVAFKNRRLVIPQLHITRATEANWRNFIAWEQNRCARAQFIPPLRGENRISCEFSWYALFIQGLICCEHDIKRLIDRNVMVVDDDLKLSNKDLLLLLNDIAKGVNKINMKSHFNRLFQDLNGHPSSVNRFVEKLSIFWHYCRRLLTGFGDKWEKSYTILKREYTPTVWKRVGIAYATVLLLLTIAQVVLQVISK